MIYLKPWIHFIAQLAICVITTQVIALELQQKAPAFNLAGTSAGASVNSLANAGKAVYVDFWASWCGPCRQSFPWLNDMQKKYGSKGLVVVGINVDKKREDADKFLAAIPAEFTLAFDPTGQTPKEWGVKGMPSSYLIGRDGRIRLIHAGFREQDRDALEEQIKKALAEGATK
jgi:cytochrome c biogenesis protein CcmG, thiol:disulfide interchange protein DsbE